MDQGSVFRADSQSLHYSCHVLLPKPTTWRGPWQKYIKNMQQEEERSKNSPKPCRCKASNCLSVSRSGTSITSLCAAWSPCQDRSELSAGHGCVCLTRRWEAASPATCPSLLCGWRRYLLPESTQAAFLFIASPPVLTTAAFLLIYTSRSSERSPQRAKCCQGEVPVTSAAIIPST